MLYVVDNTDLTYDAFNESFGHHVIPVHGSQGGYLLRLFFDIRGAKFNRLT